MGVALLVLAIAFVSPHAFHWASVAYWQANLLGDQRHLMDFSPPEGQVGFVRPASKPDLDGDFPIYQSRDFAMGRGYVPDGLWTPGSAPATRLGGGNVASLALPTLFLHSRQSQSGHTRLVHIALKDFNVSGAIGGPSWVSRTTTTLTLQDEVYEPATWRLGSTLRQIPSGGLPGLTAFFIQVAVNEEYAGPAVRLSFGQPDPNDAARFEIHYEYEGVPGTIEGRLGNDDSIAWATLSGPLEKRTGLTTRRTGAQAGCGSIRGTVSIAQTPRAAIAALSRTHPGAQIDRIERVLSGGPPCFRLDYHEGQSQKSNAEYRYSDYGNILPAPDEVLAGLRDLHPDATVDRVQFFEDMANGFRLFQVKFHYRFSWNEFETWVLPDGTEYLSNPPLAE